jgi:hypothetical protein
MAITKTTPPTASDVPKKERRLIAHLGGLGFDVDLLDKDAENLFVVFIVGENPTDTEECPTKLSNDLVTAPLSCAMSLIFFSLGPTHRRK